MTEGQIDELMFFIRKFKQFENMFLTKVPEQREFYTKLLKQFVIKEYKKDDPIYHFGTIGNRCYIILEGEVSEYVHKSELMIQREIEELRKYEKFQREVAEKKRKMLLA